MKKSINAKWLCLSGIFLTGLVIYSCRMTYSGLWYDEAVEYFFSKFMFGNVPGSIGITNNMYERICSTYQPPLYNVLMYVWLKFFDSELLFRLAGVLTTLLGMSGIYMGLYELSGHKWASAGAMIYILIPAVGRYALECAEYNLMLCLEAWVLYFFVMTVRKKDSFSLGGFFLFSCLSVYTQYGAVFFVAGVYIVLLISSFQDRVFLRKIAVLTLSTVFIAVLPLVYFFLLPQIIRQGTASISHSFVFKHGNFLYDFIAGIISQARWTMYLNTSTPVWNLWRIALKSATVIPIMASVLAAAVLMFQKKDKLFMLLIGACIISWLIYYLCVASSFYAYNNWSGNTGFGNRYGLFFVPLCLFTLVYAAFIFCRTGKHKKLCFLLIMCFIAGGVINTFKTGIKDDVREAAEVWYKQKGFNAKTLVHQWDDANFQFYIRHNDNYSDTFQENIITAGIWIRSASYEDMLAKLEEIGIFELDSLFYVAPSFNVFTQVMDVFTQVMEDSGYRVCTLYDGLTKLLYCSRKLTPQ